MCTVTVIPTEQGIRLISNRDESRSRAHANAPVRHNHQGVSATWPIDPIGGGTWIAAADHGLCLTLLNGNPHPPFDPTGLSILSRGIIIPALISQSSAPKVIQALANESLDLTLSKFVPFRLVAVDTNARLIDAVWDREKLHITEHPEPIACFASSGLGDHLVQCRLPLFDQTVRPNPTPDAQDQFHHHQWSDRSEFSVKMARADARTVSVTTVDLVPGCPAQINYEPIEGN